ncbi:MAG: hypothetical protein ACE5GC_01560 [Acidimicrobiia bacterium]
MFTRRPADNRPQDKGTGGSRSPSFPPQEFSPLLSELLSTRARLESLRSSDGSLMDRAMLRDRLHELRADLAQRRRGRR